MTNLEFVKKVTDHVFNGERLAMMGGQHSSKRKAYLLALDDIDLAAKYLSEKLKDDTV